MLNIFVGTAFYLFILLGFVTSCVGTDFQNTLLKEICKGREDEEEDVSGYRMPLRKQKKPMEIERGSAGSYSLESSL